MADNNEKKTEEMVELAIPLVDNNKKSNTLRLSLNGRVLKLERGKTHKVPKAFADLYNFKLAERRKAMAYSKKMLAENNQPKI